MIIGRRLVLLLALTIGLVACGDDEPTADSNNANNGANNGTNAGTNNGTGNNGTNNGTIANNVTNNGTTANNTTDYLAPLGGVRPTTPILPSDFDPSKTYPLVVQLHGYGVNARLQRLYFGLESVQDERQFIFLAPDGLVDDVEKRFWNATDYCCDFYGKGQDDVAYISGLITEAKARYNVDASRVYFLGHSNGGFMSYRMACELSEEITAIVSLAGASFKDPTDCSPSEPVSVLQIHGTLDATILYNGFEDPITSAVYPSAEESAGAWVGYNGCDAAAADGPSADLTTILGNETQTKSWGGCDGGSTVELWTLMADGHIPTFNASFKEAVLDFMFSHQK